MRASLRVKRGRHVTVASVVSFSMGVHLVLIFFCFCSFDPRDYDTTSYAIGAWNLSRGPEAQWHADSWTVQIVGSLLLLLLLLGFIFRINGPDEQLGWTLQVAHWRRKRDPVDMLLVRTEGRRRPVIFDMNSSDQITSNLSSHFHSSSHFTHDMIIFLNPTNEHVLLSCVAESAAMLILSDFVQPAGRKYS
jgi:hypothetical protein